MPVLDPAELPTLGHLFRLHCWVHAAHVSPNHVKLHTRHIYRAPNLTGRQAAYCENHMFHSFPFHSRLKAIHADGMLRWNAAHADLHQSLATTSHDVDDWLTADALVIARLSDRGLATRSWNRKPYIMPVIINITATHLTFSINVTHIPPLLILGPISRLQFSRSGYTLLSSLLPQ